MKGFVYLKIKFITSITFYVTIIISFRELVNIVFTLYKCTIYRTFVKIKPRFNVKQININQLLYYFVYLELEAFLKYRLELQI